MCAPLGIAYGGVRRHATPACPRLRSQAFAAPVACNTLRVAALGNAGKVEPPAATASKHVMQRWAICNAGSLCLMRGFLSFCVWHVLAWGVTTGPFIDAAHSLAVCLKPLWRDVPAAWAGQRRGGC
jgi:hypothetical protein